MKIHKIFFALVGVFLTEESSANGEEHGGVTVPKVRLALLPDIFKSVGILYRYKLCALGGNGNCIILVFYSTVFHIEILSVF